jgi:hypothetical protein
MPHRVLITFGDVRYRLGISHTRLLALAAAALVGRVQSDKVICVVIGPGSTTCEASGAPWLDQDMLPKLAYS